MDRAYILANFEKLNFSPDLKLIINRSGYFGFRQENEVKYQSLDGKFNDHKENEISGVNLNVCFPVLEKCLNPTFNGVGDGEAPSHMRPYLHNVLFGEDTVGSMLTSKFPFVIHNEDDLIQIKSLLIDFWNFDAKPFFDYWSNLSDFLPFLEVDFEDYRSMNNVLGVDAILKKMIIWWQCSHPKSLDFINHREQKLIALRQSEPKNQKVEKALIQFLEIKQRLLQNDHNRRY